jgi:Rrf2 family transcriptional regulator, nitric oxide-sensitive transcriptional repressor
MIKINRKVEYALMVLKAMTQKDLEDLTTAREVCDRFHTPFDTTAKVMQQMNAGGILQSQKGVKGGYTLARDLSQVSYIDLAQMIEGKSFMMNCESGEGCELLHSCNISGPIKRLNEYLISIFSTLTLNELLAEDNLLAMKKMVTL